MAKNTEWGTAAMLSASVYGQAPVGNKVDETTTGNESGVYQMAGSTGSYSGTKGTEIVAGIWTGKVSVLGSPDPKYYDLYESATSKPGDATTETAGWKGSSGASFIGADYPIFQRSYNGLFGYAYHLSYYISGSSGNYWASCDPGSRAVAVCYPGI